MSEPNISIFEQHRDYWEAFADKVSSLVLHRYSQMVPSGSIENVQLATEYGLVSPGRTSEDRLIVHEKDKQLKDFVGQTYSTSTQNWTILGFLHATLMGGAVPEGWETPNSNQNYDTWNTNMENGEVILNSLTLSYDTNISKWKFYHQLQPQGIIIPNEWWPSIHSTLSQFVTVKPTKNILDVGKTKEFLDTTITEFSPKIKGDIIQQRILNLFKDFRGIKKHIGFGNVFQGGSDGTDAKFLDKTAVTYNYLIKQCLDRIYEDVDIIFTEDQYRILYNQYKDLFDEYHQEITSSMATHEIKDENLTAKQTIVYDMIHNVFATVISNFNITDGWRVQFEEALQTLTNNREDKYIRVGRNIVNNASHLMHPIVRFAHEDETTLINTPFWPNAIMHPGGVGGNSVPVVSHLSGWSVYQQRNNLIEGNAYSNPTLGKYLDWRVYDASQDYQYSSTEQISYDNLNPGDYDQKSIKWKTPFKISEGSSQVYAGGGIDSNTEFFINSQIAHEYPGNQNADINPNSPGTIIPTNGFIRCSKQYFEYYHPNGKKFIVNIAGSIASAMAREPFWPMTPTTDAETGEEGIIPTPLPVSTNENGLGTVSEAYIMFVGSDKGRFNAQWDNSYSLDFVVAYRGGGIPLAFIEDYEDGETPTTANLEYADPGSYNRWYYDNGEGFSVGREFTVNKNDAIVARLYRTNPQSEGIEQIEFEDTNLGVYSKDINDVKLPFTAYVDNWESNLIPPELIIKPNFEAAFGGQSPVDTLTVVHEPPQAVLSDIGSSEDFSNFFSTEVSNDGYFIRPHGPNISNIALEKENQGEKYVFSVYVRTDSNNPITILPFCSAYPILSGATLSSQTERFERGELKPMGEQLLFSTSDGWTRLRWQDVELPASLDINKQLCYGFIIGYAGASVDTGDDTAAGAGGQFTYQDIPEISIAAPQLEVGGTALTPWREPGEYLLNADPTTEPPPEYEQTVGLGALYEDIVTIPEPDGGWINPDFDTNTSMEVDSEIIPDSETATVKGISIFHKSWLEDSDIANNLIPGDIIRTQPEPGELLEMIQVVATDYFGNYNYIMVKRGLNGIPPTEFPAGTMIKIWKIYGPDNEASTEDDPISFTFTENSETFWIQPFNMFTHYVSNPAPGYYNDFIINTNTGPFADYTGIHETAGNVLLSNGEYFKVIERPYQGLDNLIRIRRAFTGGAPGRPLTSGGTGVTHTVGNLVQIGTLAI